MHPVSRADRARICHSPARPPSRPSSRFGSGCKSPNSRPPFRNSKEVWQEAEALGFDTLWTQRPPAAQLRPCRQGQPGGLDAAGSHGRRHVPGSGSVPWCPAILPSPLGLAKMATTVDPPQPRPELILGVGFGFGLNASTRPLAYPSRKSENAASDWTKPCRVITALWSADPTASFSGTYYSLVDAPFEPKPVQQPTPRS